MRKTKIVATVGPATDSPETLARLIEKGVNVFRLNFSHGSHEGHAELIKRIRAAEEETGRPVAILQDISGPKLRIGEIEGELKLKVGDFLDLVAAAPKEETEHKWVTISYPEILDDLNEDDLVYFADGTIRAKVVAKEMGKIVLAIHVGGALTSRKGENFPGVKLSIPTITAKDRNDMIFGAEHGVDIVALSFVRRKEDILEARSILIEHHSHAVIVPKIEMMEAVQNIHDILDVSDGIMVARGDLGVEAGVERVPVIQKKIISAANDADKPVITATQMLTSMLHSPYPTRAEVSDVANAVLDGTDAVMLSDETAVGSYPEEAIEVLNSVITETESIYPYYNHRESHNTEEAIAAGAINLAKSVKADGIIVLTRSGNTAKAIARQRPASQIISITNSETTYRQLSLVWGIKASFHVTPYEHNAERIYSLLRRGIDKGFISQAKTYVLIMGVPAGEAGHSNMIRYIDPDNMEAIFKQFEGQEQAEV